MKQQFQQLSEQRLILDYIFNDKEVDEDEMFALKIALFEIDKIKDSKNLDGKKALRKRN